MADLDQCLTKIGLSLVDLQRNADQIILFGSRAAGLARSTSDWDLLVIGSGEGRSRHTPALDLVWLTPHALASSDWLTSELAGHVARYGRWIHGAPDWTFEATCGAVGAARKARRLASRIAALEGAWEGLPARLRCKHYTLIRRDLQRHDLLSRGEPVPPSLMLDEAWRITAVPEHDLLCLSATARVRSPFVERELLHLAKEPQISPADHSDMSHTPTATSVRAWPENA